MDYFIVNGTAVAERWNYANGSEYFTMRYTFDETGSVIGFSTHYPEFVAGYWEDYLFAKNLQGDVVAMYLITVEPPRLIATYEYDEWGKVKTVRDATGAILTDPAHLANRNPFRYRSYHYDIETGFYYLQSRYYDPVISRFINADSYATTGQGFLGTNMFAYCNNNPVNYADPEGNLLERVLGGLIGAGLGALTTWATGGSTREIINAALIGGAAGAFPEIGTFINVCSAVKTAWDCWSSGASFLGGVACGVFSYGAGCIGGKTGDQLTDKLVEYVFGTPANLFSNITSNTVQQNAQRAREEKRNSSPQPNLADWGERPFISPDPEKPVCGGGGRRVRCYW